MSKFEGRKEVNVQSLHPNQLAVMKRMALQATLYQCEQYEVRQYRAKELLKDFLENFTMSEVYHKAKSANLSRGLMRYVEAVAWIQAQGVALSEYPKYNLQGEEVFLSFGYNCDIAPHLNANEDYRFLAREIFQEAKKRARIEINLSDEVKKAIRDKWGYMKEVENAKSVL